MEYWARLVQSDEACIIDPHEHYIKRSMRNRTEIMTANGVMPLSVHLCRANRPQTPMCDLRIDYSKRWQHQHWVAILSAYRSSPYFDLYAPSIEPFYTRRYDSLVEYNMEILETLLRLMGVEKRFSVSGSYVAATDADTDFRPKHFGGEVVVPEYFQLFSDRMPFVPNLSILDLLMSEGPSTRDLLKRVVVR
ncbi:MAG: WbqC family protein [Alistipes sp.]|nr:WbqC family protein [Alistipes sp.]